MPARYISSTVGGRPPGRFRCAPTPVGPTRFPPGVTATPARSRWPSTRSGWPDARTCWPPRARSWRDLACGCPLELCHRDVLLDVANPPANAFRAGGHAMGLTLRRPWASLMLVPEQLGGKPVETRSCATAGRCCCTGDTPGRCRHHGGRGGAVRCRLARNAIGVAGGRRAGRCAPGSGALLRAVGASASELTARAITGFSPEPRGWRCRRGGAVFWGCDRCRGRCWCAAAHWHSVGDRGCDDDR